MKVEKGQIRRRTVGGRVVEFEVTGVSQFEYGWPLQRPDRESDEAVTVTDETGRKTYVPGTWFVVCRDMAEPRRLWWETLGEILMTTDKVLDA